MTQNVQYLIRLFDANDILKNLKIIDLILNKNYKKSTKKNKKNLGAEYINEKFIFLVAESIKRSNKSL